jgi:pimeloyl-ACP methyl ester carboxylesterase
MHRISGLVTLLCLALGVSVLGSSSPTQAAPARVDPPAVPVIEWAPCGYDRPQDDPDCAVVPVPLDYDDPTGPTLDLDLLRVPATDPSRRIGTLFVNPGGPGAPADSFAMFFGELVPPEVSARFDIVGIDPRGTGSSAPAVCRKPGRPPSYPGSFFPVTHAQARDQIRYDSWLRSACRTGGAPVIDHLTTADTARDLDLIRQAVGDPQLTYYGISYGTHLGSTYAAMFPGNIRAMILDGVLDPVAWSTGRGGEAGQPFSERIGSGRGAWQALVNALAECDRVGRKHCAIAGHASEVWRDTVRRLRREPFDGTTYPDLVGSALLSLYDAPGIRWFVRMLGNLHEAMVTGGRAPRVVARVPERGIVPGPYAAPAYARGGNPFAAIACADSDNPSDPWAWEQAARRSDRHAPWFGAAWTWASSACAGWPASTKADRFTGPYAVTPSAPVLVVGNTFDPATPLSGARAVNRLLDGSRLLVLDGWGHGALHTGPCIGNAYERYLVNLTLPASGTVCRPARPLFGR